MHTHCAALGGPEGRAMIRPLLIAIQFLTRLPVPVRGTVANEDVRRSLAFYPAVGALLGACIWLGAWALQDFDPLLRAALLVALWTALTGALHLDGLADCVDASAGSRGDPARARAILKDPRCGSMGVVAVVILLLLKFAALAALPAQPGAALLLLPPVLARTAVVVLFLAVPYVSPGGLGAALAAPGPATRNRAAVAAAVLLLWLLAGTDAVLWGLAGAALSFAAVVRWLRGVFRGVTGDGAGALVEITEAALLVLLLTVAV